MAARQATVVSKVYVASYIKNVANVLRNALGAVGGIDVQELTMTPQGLTDDCIDQIPDIEYLFADPSAIGQVISHPKTKAKWIQNTFAGLEAIFRVVDKMENIPAVLLTRQTAGFGQSMAEYVIGEIIARERNFQLMCDLQRQSTYDYSQVMNYRNLDDLNLGILGLGTIGVEVARQCKALNMTVWAGVRDERFNSGQTNCEHVHYYRPMSRLSEMLQEVDYLVNIMPSTPHTRGLLSGEVLKSCEKKKTVFINIGRGDVIDDSSLIHALKSGWLGGAILDVFNTEPLPSSSPLWSLPGVTITPHVSGITDINKAVKTFVINLERYQSGQPLMNQVDFTKEY